MTVRFLLNDQLVEERDVRPTRTVLEYLRETRRLTGTKEGCAEGDCGACTIAVGRRDGKRVRYAAANSCLMLLPQLDGASVVTVEGLAAADGTLHPVQRAMVETDGTQCGFCTPGFVMAMFAFRENGEKPEDDTIHEALAGNLCRCTGYRPIIDAVRHAALDPADPFAEKEAETARRLAAIRPARSHRADGEAYHSPGRLEELLSLLGSHPDALLWAGGTDLGLRVAKDRARPATIVSTARVREMRGVARTETDLLIGAAVSYAEALPALSEAFPAFGELVRRIGSRQIRNLGTLGGNLANASAIGDTLPCLIALGAALSLASAKGMREVAVEDFFVSNRRTVLAAGEAIVSLRIPLLADGRMFGAEKLSRRRDQDISAVVGAFAYDVRDGQVANPRIAFGGMAATPKRAVACERALTGKPWTLEALDGIETALAEDFSPIDDHRATGAYRAQAAANLLRRNCMGRAAS